MTEMRDYAVWWVCFDCYAAHHGLADDVSTPDRAPLALLPADGWDIFAGLPAEEHAADCPVWLGDPNRADVPVAGAECECERREFTWSACHGCGSQLGGAREALTGFERAS